MNIFRNGVVVTGLTGLLALAVSGCSMWEGRKARESGRTVTQYQNDRATSDRVEDALDAASVYKFPNVHVETFQGNVQLSGFVSTDAQKSAAEKIARQTPGVQQVINSLTLVPAPVGRTQGYPQNPGESSQVPRNAGTNTENTVPNSR